LLILLNYRGLEISCDFASSTQIHSINLKMNTASKLGPHTQTDRGTCPGVGLLVYFKSCYPKGPGGKQKWYYWLGMK
jgi:hypothetical protein